MRAGGALCVLLLLAVAGAALALGGGGDRPPMRLDKELKCVACNVVVEALEKALDVDAGATVKVGHRLVSGTKPTDGGGKHIAYARSEMHIMDTLDGLCKPLEKFDAIQTNEDGSRSFVEINNRPKGTKSSVSLRGGEGRAVADLCFKILENHEDELSEILRKNEEVDLKSKVCRQMTKLCRKKKKKAPVEQAPEAEKEPVAEEPVAEKADL